MNRKHMKEIKTNITSKNVSEENTKKIITKTP